MITFLSVVSILFGILAGKVLTILGRYSINKARWTDALVLVPFLGGVVGLLYVLGTLASRFLP